MGEQIEPPVLNAGHLQESLAKALIRLEKMQQGKLLTFIDSLGFDKDRGKAVKDVTSSIIKETLEYIAVNELDSIIDICQSHGFNKDDENEKHPSYGSLIYYRHWDNTRHN